MRRDGRYCQRSPRDLRSVQSQRPGGADPARRIREIHVVLHCEELPVRVVRSAQRPVDVLVLQKPCVRRPVRIDQPVQAEVPVVLQLSVVSAVPVHLLPVIRCSLIDRMIAPLPNESAAECRIFLGQVQILLEVTWAVAHGMAVLHEEERLVRLVVEVIRDFVKTRVHAPDEVDTRDIEVLVGAFIERALIGREPRRVGLLCPAQSLFERAAVTALVSHRPDQDRGAVPVPDDHGTDPVQRRLDEIRVVRDPDMRLAHPLRVVLLPEREGAGPVALIVGFVYDVEAQFVAELVEPGRIGIMAGPDRVEIVGLDHAQVLQRLIEAAHRPGHGVRFVAVDAAESDG